MAKHRKSSGSRVRTRKWDTHTDTFTHDRARHLWAEKQLLDADQTHLAISADITPNGMVVSPYGTLCFVEMDGDEVVCKVGDGLMEGKSSILAPGDRVHVGYNDNQPVVQAMSPRRTKLSRPATTAGRAGAKRACEQVFAANVDLLVIVAAAARPLFKPGLVDRYLIAAEVGGVTPILCINKMDLVDTEPETVPPFRDLGLVVFNTSCETGHGLDALREHLCGKLSVFAGHSGVGKSSLLNALDPALAITTREVSDFNEKGRHTTSASRLYHLARDIHIIDTPGIKQLGLWGVSREEVAYYFPEIAAAAESCRFRDCSHVQEPGCGIRAAVESGAIRPLRYHSYLRIRETL